MSNTIPMRVDSELFEAAKTVGGFASRSAAQQFSHWARIGRELESAPGASASDVQRVLAGDQGATYDMLSLRDQAIVRANWEESVAERLKGLDFTAEFEGDGSQWSEADEQGTVTVHGSKKSN